MKPDVHPLRVLGKALILFVLINILYGLIDPSLGTVSAYNLVIPGRVRFPFGSASDPYVVMVDNLDVMAASHVISLPKNPDEYRVVLIGDSSIWGEKSSAKESISELWNALHIQCGNRQLIFYNLGYPHPSVIKDVMILDKAMEYKPDMVIWFVTLNTLIPKNLSPFIAANSERAVKIQSSYDISLLNEEELAVRQPSFYEKTLIGKRSDLARAIKLQALGLLWMASGLDKKTSKPVPFLPQDVNSDVQYRGLEPGKKIKNKLLFNVIEDGQKIANPVPILIVNEPIFVASGWNSDIRYNNGYPRWAYDQYRQALAEQAQRAGWNYLDMWDAVPTSGFADAVLHVSPAGDRVLIQKIDPFLEQLACP